MRDKSAGIILYRIRNNLIEFLVCHTGGPYGKGTDQDRWSIPKGKIEIGEESLDAAKREVLEETGITDTQYSSPIYIGVAKQSRKDVHVYAAQYLLDKEPIANSNWTILEWPRGSGNTINIPEIDRIEFVSAEIAKYRLIRGQKEMIDKLIDLLRE